MVSIEGTACCSLECGLSVFAQSTCGVAAGRDGFESVDDCGEISVCCPCSSSADDGSSSLLFSLSSSSLPLRSLLCRNLLFSASEGGLSRRQHLLQAKLFAPSSTSTAVN